MTFVSSLLETAGSRVIHVSRTASRGLFASIARLLPFVRADHINLAMSGFNTI